MIDEEAVERVGDFVTRAIAMVDRLVESEVENKRLREELQACRTAKAKGFPEFGREIVGGTVSDNGCE